VKYAWIVLLAGVVPAVSAPAVAQARPVANRCGSVTLVARTGERPAPVCLRRGATLRVVTEPSPRQPWSLPASSDRSMLRCVSRRRPEGAAVATCRARRAGTVTVATQTAPFAGDPHGPPEYLWQVTVTIPRR
jgi:hypothetical protein